MPNESKTQDFNPDYWKWGEDEVQPRMLLVVAGRHPGQPLAEDHQFRFFGSGDRGFQRLPGQLLGHRPAVPRTRR